MDSEAHLLGGAEDPVVVDEPHDHRVKLAPGEWVKANLFDSKMNAVITVVVSLAAIALAIFGIRWVATADFAIVRANLRLFMVGQFPRDELWRLWVSGFMILASIGFVSGALAHNAHDVALVQGLPSEKSRC